MYDVTIIGGGIVGLASAYALAQQYPHLRLAVLEKERDVGTHQTGHNSGVIHAGMYYRPGSLKARLCVEGSRALVAFCDEHGIPYELCGKLIVATEERELPVLETIYERGKANGVRGLAFVEKAQLNELEPHAAGLRAIHSPGTGIIDFGQVARTLARVLEDAGCDIKKGHRVTGIRQSSNQVHVLTTGGDVATRYLINCAGLYSDAIARMAGVQPDVQIVPFRGEYYFLKDGYQHLVRNLIYPVPDPSLPFLGVHFTRTIHGQVEAGPNAVLAFAREGYSRSRVDLRELWQALTFPGLWHVARKYWKTGLYEMYRSFSKGAFVRDLKKLVPAVEGEHLVRGGAGVRAQAVGRDGKLLDDFHILETPRTLHVLNAPSPAATASLAIGRYVTGLAASSFGLARDKSP